MKKFLILVAVVVVVVVSVKNLRKQPPKTIEDTYKVIPIPDSFIPMDVVRRIV